MNILFICDEYPPGKNGGIGSAIQTLGRELVRQGHKVFVVGLYAHSYGQQDHFIDQGVQVWRLRYGLRVSENPDSILYKVFNKIPRSVKQHLNGRKAFGNYISFINKLIMNQNIEIIEIPDYNTFTLNIGFRVEWPPFTVPLLLKSHGSYTKLAHDLHQKTKSEYVKADELLYKRADALAAVSDDTASINTKLFRPDKKIKTLYNGISLPQIAPATRQENKVIYTGTLTAQKGIYQLIKAWNTVIKSFPKAELLIFGKGHRLPLTKLISEDAQDSVHFKGHVTREKLFEELGRATMAVFPSFSESFSLAPLEAMAVGCPVIYTSRSSGTELITEGQNGELVDPEKEHEIAAKIIKLLGDRPLREKYSQMGKATIMERFTIEKSAKAHLEYYQKIIAESNLKKTT